MDNYAKYIEGFISLLTLTGLLFLVRALRKGFEAEKALALKEYEEFKKDDEKDNSLLSDDDLSNKNNKRK